MFVAATFTFPDGERVILAQEGTRFMEIHVGRTKFTLTLSTPAKASRHFDVLCDACERLGGIEGEIEGFVLSNLANALKS